MRLPFLLCLALAACSSDPAPPMDAGPADTGAPVDLGLDAPPDITEDRPASPDVPGDQGVDAAPDVPTDVLPSGCVSTTTGNCCGVACPTPPNATTAACLGGRCGVGECAPGFGDCDGSPANGCEVDLRTSATNCGACGAACAPGRGCAASACVACDADSDGALIPACGGMDCDDTNPRIRPGATELCNGLDDNCDGTRDAMGSPGDTYCLGLEATHFAPAADRTWLDRAACAAATVPTSGGFERYAGYTMACRRCSTRRGADGGLQRSCICAFDSTNASFLCN